MSAENPEDTMEGRSSVPLAGDARPAAAPAVEPTSGSTFETTLGERVSDRLNPILVREVLQALHGRAFVATLTLSLFAIVLIALSVTSRADVSRPTGGRAFVLALQGLAPVLLFLLPFRAFLSMRQEVMPGTLEHLLLSRLTPGRIVRGKLFAGCVEFGLFLSVFAPLLALTYLLRGIDIPTIALVLGLAFVCAFAATSLAVAMGALSRWPGGRALPLVALALGLSMTTVAFVSGMPSIVWSLRMLPQRSAAVEALLTILIPVALGSVLLSLVACAALAHPYENRSTSFRAFAVVCLLVGIGWVTYTILAHPSTGMFRITVSSFLPGFIAVAAVPLAPFWLFAVTEEEAFSPRMRAIVPRRSPLAMLAAPFLPGGGRGMLFTVLLAATAVACAGLVPVWFEGKDPDANMWRVAVGMWAYTLMFAGIVGFVRRRWLPPGPRGSAIARVGAPFLVLVFTMVPTLVALFTGSSMRSWSPLDVVSPASTIEELERDHGNSAALPILLSIVAIILLLQLPAIGRGLRETIDASRARRLRAR